MCLSTDILTFRHENWLIFLVELIGMRSDLHLFYL